MLVPLTPSVFVPGRLSTVDRVLVDVGTGFYVGKPTAAAAEILAKKVRWWLTEGFIGDGAWLLMPACRSRV